MGRMSLLYKCGKTDQMMTVYKRKDKIGRFGRVPATVNESPQTGPGRSEQEVEGESIAGGPGLPASPGVGSTSRPVDLGETIPVWLAALIAASCKAAVNDTHRAIEWSCFAGRALYTNKSRGAELIQPLGIHLDQGHTLAVSWTPGQTEYTFEVLR